MTLFWSFALTAQDPKWTTLKFHGENDALAVANTSDEFYTNGIRFFAMRHPEYTPDLIDYFEDWWCGWACPDMSRRTNIGFAGGHLIYTPDDISTPTLTVDDRPYAGWLYGAFLLNISDRDAQKKQHSFELQLGIIGPESGAEWVQTQFHEWGISSQLPMGWDNQLPTELGINLIYRYQQIYWRDKFNHHFDVVTHLGGALGTINVMADAGATVRFGWNISGFPQSEIPASIESRDADKDGSDDKWELYFFAGFDSRAVAHNIFLDGTVFRDSHSVEKEVFVTDLRAGFSFRVDNWRFHYAFVRRSEEFSPLRGQFDGLHNFGSFTLGVERSFK